MAKRSAPKPNVRGPRDLTRLYAVPPPGDFAFARLATQASGWKPVRTRVHVLGEVRHVRWINFSAWWVECQIIGEDKPRDIEIRRFPLRSEWALGDAAPPSAAALVAIAADLGLVESGAELEAEDETEEEPPPRPPVGGYRQRYDAPARRARKAAGVA